MTGPRVAVPRLAAPPAAGDPLARVLATAARLPPFRLMTGECARYRTNVRLAWDELHLHVEFRCEDRDAWGTFRRRDDPLWREEVVEIFLAAGDGQPANYFELEISPLGVLFDARVENRADDRRTMTVDVAWNCEGLLWRVDPLVEREDWRARIAIPWRGLGLGAAPRALRANFYRVERPRNVEADGVRVPDNAPRSPSDTDEFSGWSPTGSSPPDFHRPSRFGFLDLLDFD